MEIDKGKLLYYSNKQNINWLNKTFEKECENTKTKNRKIKNKDLENECNR